jgi:hypothetical protein
VTPPLPEVRVSPDGSSVAIRWPGAGGWRAVSRSGWWYGSPSAEHVAGWPRLLAPGVPQEDAADSESAADGHPT